MEHWQLINFITVCEEKNISKAAARLFISQQGLSSSIKQLEESLGMDLFLRNHWGVELTVFGAALEKAVRPYLKQHDYIVAEMQRLKEKERARVLIGITIGGSFLLPRHFFKNFFLLHPEIQVELTSYTEDDCLKSVLDYKIQLGFSPGPIDLNSFDSLWAERRKIFIVTGKGHPLAKHASIKLKDLQHETVIILHKQTTPESLILEKCVQNGIRPSIYLGSGEDGFICELCETNRIVSFFAGPMEKYPGLARIEIEDFDLYWEFHLVINKHVYLDEGAKIFIDYALATLGEEPLNQKIAWLFPNIEDGLVI
jgi:DNA-binding transcriptional LysR family regulator